MTELVRLMARMGWVSCSIVTPDVLGTVLTTHGKAGLVQLYLISQHCQFAFTTSKQQCLNVLFDAHIDKAMLERLRTGDAVMRDQPKKLENVGVLKTSPE